MRDPNNKVIKTIERGVCRHCKKEVEWSDTDCDYETVQDGECVCVLAPSNFDHEPLPPKSQNFNSLYNKLLG